jgi:hypothetical protein
MGLACSVLYRAFGFGVCHGHGVEILREKFMHRWTHECNRKLCQLWITCMSILRLKTKIENAKTESSIDARGPDDSMLRPSSRWEEMLKITSLKVS